MFRRDANRASRVHGECFAAAFSPNWPVRATTGDTQTEGWLLYAAVDRDFDYHFGLVGQSIRVCSINLEILVRQPWRTRIPINLVQEWMGIERDFKRLVGV